MKRVVIAILAIVMACCLTACGGDTDGDTAVAEEMSEDIKSEDVQEEENEETEENQVLPQANVTGNFEVHYLDVGQADATLVGCDGKYMLIDGGNSEDSSLIYAYLKEHQVEHLDYMICTHAHEDHVGGLAGALNYATVGTVYSPVKSFDTDAFNDFLKYVNKQGKEITIPETGETFQLGEATCQILGLNSYADDPNNTSIVLKITYGETAFLFSGDAEQSVETGIIDAGYDVRCDVIKVPHHGSDTSLSYRWLNEAMPEYGIISVGENNSYGHPNEDTLSKLRDADVKVFRTDMQGHIICRSDGKILSFELEQFVDADTLSDAGPGQKEKDKQEEKAVSSTYILNVNTKKIHYPTCRSVKQMKEENKQESNLSREELIGQGYSPCGNCNP